MAFRCGNKLVKEGMHEVEVRAICGEPYSVRHLGYAIRPYDIGSRYRGPVGFGVSHYPIDRQLNQEVVVTELVYNFGPRKLMRRLVFEAGMLVETEPLGYGHDNRD